MAVKYYTYTVLLTLLVLYLYEESLTKDSMLRNFVLSPLLLNHRKTDVFEYLARQASKDLPDNIPVCFGNMSKTDFLVDHI